MSAPTESPVAGAAAPAAPVEKHRVHNSYIWLGSLRAVGLVVVVLVVTSLSSIVSLIELATSGPTDLIGAMLVLGAAAVGVVLLLGLVVLVHYLAYRHLWYELGPHEFTLCSGIISKKRVHVAYPRVQSVDQRASLMQRLFGVCNVTVDTAGGASNKAILVPYLTIPSRSMELRKTSPQPNSSARTAKVFGDILMVSLPSLMTHI